MPKPVTDLPNAQVMPAPALEKRTRRKFSPEYKLRILTEANACQRGELGALLRRENLYSNQLQQWRREFAEQGVQGLSKSSPGPSPSMTPDQRRIAELEKANARALTRFLHEVERLWRKWLDRRSWRGRMTWERFVRLAQRYPLPPPRVVRRFYRCAATP